jgi:hypothetical protein
MECTVHHFTPFVHWESTSATINTSICGIEAWSIVLALPLISAMAWMRNGQCFLPNIFLRHAIFLLRGISTSNGHRYHSPGQTVSQRLHIGFDLSNSSSRSPGSVYADPSNEFSDPSGAPGYHGTEPASSCEWSGSSERSSEWETTSSSSLEQYPEPATSMPSFYHLSNQNSSKLTSHPSTVSWSWNGSHPSGTATEVKAGDVTVTSHRGNDITKTGTQSDPAVHVSIFSEFLLFDFSSIHELRE